MSCFVLKTVSAGTRAFCRRSAFSVHDSGRNNAKSMGRCCVRVVMLRLTATWQLAILQADPVYCRCTPTECFPCLRKPVSSMTQATTGSRSSSAAMAYRAAARRTSWSSHDAFEMKWWILWWPAPACSGSPVARAAIGSMLLRSDSPSRPIAYIANDARRWLLPSSSPMLSRYPSSRHSPSASIWYAMPPLHHAAALHVEQIHR